MNSPSPIPRPLGLSRRRWAQACAAWVCTGMRAGSAQTPGAAPAQMAWPSQLPLLDAPPLSEEQLRSKPCVLVFFSIDCPYCRRHNQRLNKLAAQYGDRIRVIGAATDTDLNALRHYRDSQGLSFALSAGSQALRARVTPRKVIPFTAVIAADGSFKERIPGEMTEEDIMGLVRWAPKGEQR